MKLSDTANLDLIRALKATEAAPELRIIEDHLANLEAILDKLFVESVNIAKDSESPYERYWAGRAHGIREAVLTIKAEIAANNPGGAKFCAKAGQAVGGDLAGEDT